MNSYHYEGRAFSPRDKVIVTADHKDQGDEGTVLAAVPGGLLIHFGESFATWHPKGLRHAVP